MTDLPSSSRTDIPRAPLRHTKFRLDSVSAASFGLLPPSSRTSFTFKKSIL